MTEMTNAEIIQAMLDVIPDCRRWVKGDYETFKGRRHCMIGAYAQATGESIQDAILDRSPALQLIMRVIREQYPEREEWLCPCHKNTPSHVIPGFNDHKDTRYADVRLILEKAAAHEEVQE